MEAEVATHHDIENWRKYSLTRNLLTRDLQEPPGLGDSLDAFHAFPDLHENLKSRMEDPEFNFRLLREAREITLTDGPEKAAEHIVSSLMVRLREQSEQASKSVD